MAQRRRKEKGKEKRERSEAPSIFTAAGLLAFYEEEQAKVKITPGVVMGAAIAFIVVSLVFNLIH